MSIYKKYCKEVFDENGGLADFSLNYPDNFNFGYDVVDRIAENTPDKTALVWCNNEGEEHYFTFEDVRVRSNKAANVFKSRGLKRGDRVMVILKRHYEYWFVCVALHKLGVIVIPATHMLTDADLVYRIEKANINAIICTPQNNMPEKVREALRKSGTDAMLWCVQEDIEGFSNLSEDIELESADLDRVETRVSDAMILYFTSGTTGNPRGVIHDFSYPLAHIITAKYWQAAENDGLHFSVAETGWAKASWGKIYGQWLVGSAVMVYDFENFDPKQLTNIINKYGVTSFCAPPTVFRYLVRKGVSPMPNLRFACTAGEMLSPDIFQKFFEITGIPLREGYGQTETALLIANFVGTEAIPGSIGRPSPQFHIELRGKNGQPVSVGELGEIVVVPRENNHQEGIFNSYLDDDGHYSFSWRDGVYHTGDAAYMDENGVYWFCCRFDDIIKTGGYRVGPYEVEHVLMRHDAVEECSVIGVEDRLRGQAIKAFIVPSEGYTPGRELEQQIRQFSNQNLSEYKWVHEIEFVDVLPKTISGKTRKNVLRE